MCLGGNDCDTILDPISITVPVFKLVPIEVLTWSPIIDPKNIELVLINDSSHLIDTSE